MSSAAGVLTFAFGRPEYARTALDMARAIRLRDADTPLAVATDLDAGLFRGWFEQVVPWTAGYASWFERKFDLGAMSPFERTLFLDSDCMVLRPLGEVLRAFDGHDFSVAGQNVATPWWFRDPGKVRARLPRATYPGFNGGLLWFRRSERAEAVFARAKSLVAEYDALGFERLPGGGINDEPLFSLAMAEHDCRAVENAEHEIMFGPRLQRFSVDVVAGECEIARHGRIVRPMICHFEGADMERFVYERERLRVAARLRLGAGSRWIRPALDAGALVAWSARRTGARLARLRTRLA